MKQVLIISLLTIFTLNNSFALKPDTTAYAYTPNMWGVMYKDISIQTVDDFNIRGWFFPAQDTLLEDSMRYYFNNRTKIRPFEESKDLKPTIIICDGDAGNMSTLSFSLAFHYCTKGFNVITFYWRGFGESQAFPTDTNMMVYTEYITDYNAIIDYALQLETVDKEKIGVYGFSTGAFLSFAIASLRKEIKVVVGRGIFTDYDSAVEQLIQNDPNDTYNTPPDIDKYSPRMNWDNFNKPIFLIVGENDNITPKKNSTEILLKCQSNVRELWIVKGASHGGKLAPEILKSDLFIEKTVRFYTENL